MFGKSAYGKCAIANTRRGWLTRPGSQQLGAKWVEVNGGVRGRQNGRSSEFETWPATPVERVAQESSLVSSEFYPTCFLTLGSSRGRSAIQPAVPESDKHFQNGTRESDQRRWEVNYVVRRNQTAHLELS